MKKKEKKKEWVTYTQDSSDGILYSQSISFLVLEGDIGPHFKAESEPCLPMTPGFFISTNDAFKLCIFPRKEVLKEINPE